MSSNRTATLLAWCAENRIRIDHRLQITDSAAVVESRERGFSVHSRDEWIECACTLVYIPKTAVLSARSCFLSHHITFVPYGHGAHLSLALALYGELLRGKLSRWFGYLQSLPRETVDIAMFWGAENVFESQTCTCSSRGSLSADDTFTATDKQQRVSHSQCPWCVWVYDNQNAKEWLQATEVDGEQVGLMEEVRQYYHDVVEPTFHAIGTKLSEDPLVCRGPGNPVGSIPGTSAKTYGVSFQGYCHAYALVSTRAFWVDAYHGLAMVPIADAFNHTNENHVQMESDYDVCIECGSLPECEHDRGTGNTTVPQAVLSIVHPLSHDGTPTPDEVDYLEMRTVRPIPPLDEVFNTYGYLSNAVLLSRYGFMLPENEHDTVRMVLDPLSTARHLFRCVGMEQVTVGEEDDAVMVAIRNTFRGVAHNEATRSRCVSGVNQDSVGDEASAWENMTHELLRVFAYVARAWNWDTAWDDQEGLVFNPPVARPVLFQVGDVPVQISHDLVINADGKISHHLWLFCVLVASFAARTHFGASLVDVMGCARGLTEIKARLMNVQGYVARLDQDGDSVEGDMEGSGNQGSTFPPPSLELDYDTESDASAQPETESVDVSNRIPAPVADVSLETGWQDPAGTGSVQSSRHPQRRVTETSYGEASPLTGYADRTHGYGQRERSPSAEGERPWKRPRSGFIVANRESGRTDLLGKTAPGFARVEQETEDARLARLLALTVVCLCGERYRPPIVRPNARGVGMTAEELGDLADVRVSSRFRNGFLARVGGRECAMDGP